MIVLNYDKIKEVYAKKGYLFYDTGNFNLNMGFVRESDEFTDHLTDTFFIAYRDEMNIKRCVYYPCTTKAGISPALLNPKIIAGMKGVAVIVPNQYRSSYQFVDSYVGWLKYPYFQQIKPVEVWRDPNGDTHIDKNQSQTGLFGINVHRMSGIGILAGIVSNWSEGCSGMGELDWRKFLPIIRESVKRYGTTFTFTWLELKDI